MFLDRQTFLIFFPIIIMDLACLFYDRNEYALSLGIPKRLDVLFYLGNTDVS